MKESDLDSISRKWLLECVDEGLVKFDTEHDKNLFIHLVRDIAPSSRVEELKMKMKKRRDE